MAILMSLVALTIDAMLPALGDIGADLGVTNANNIQLIISMVFLGMAMGLMLYGPISDSYGRKKAIYLGIFVFLIGSVISGLSTNFTVMLVGRVIQGVGAAACRVVTVAMIRDKFSGKEMARVMSLIMVIFIMVPALAPSMGQLILLFAEWRAIFGCIFLLGLMSLVWLHLRQPETLSKANRVTFSFANVGAGIVETLSNSQTRGYTIASGIAFGAFIGYLSSAQQIMQGLYLVGDLFSLYFGGLALSIGLSSFINSRLVMHFSMPSLCIASLAMLSTTSLLFYLYAVTVGGHPDLAFFVAYLGVTFFCLGTLFGNFSTMAVEPLGHIAGVATSVISSVQTLLSVLVGGMIGQCYNGTVLPLILGFLICGIVTLVIVLFYERQVFLRTRNLKQH